MDGKVFDQLNLRLVKKYLKTGGTRCPFCDSQDLYPGTIEAEDAATQDVTCGNCKRAWTDIYEIVDCQFNISDIMEFARKEQDHAQR